MGEQKENKYLEKYRKRKRPTRKYPFFAIEFLHGRVKSYNIISYSSDALKALIKHFPTAIHQMLFFQDKILSSLTIESGGIKHTYVYPFVYLWDVADYLDYMQANYIAMGSNLLPNIHLNYPEDYNDYKEKEGKIATTKNNVINFEEAKNKIKSRKGS